MLPLESKQLTPTMILTHKRPTKGGDKAFFHQLVNFLFDELSAVKLDELHLCKAMHQFGHNEYVKNLGCVLEQVCKKVYGKDKDIMGPLLNAFILIVWKENH